MTPKEILFDTKGHAISPELISDRIDKFGDKYNDATAEIICKSEILDKDGKVFIECAFQILSSFGMTRSGIFHDNCLETLRNCWNEIGPDLLI